MNRTAILHRRIREMVIFAMLGTLMFCAKLVFEALPNVHPIALLIVAYTVVYRVKALIPIYIFVIITGIYAGFALWWIPYLYIWAVLWAFTMLLPKRLPHKVAVFVYPALCALHGVAYGILYAPAQMVLYFNADFSKMWQWILAGLPYDLIHMFGNFAAGTLVFPLVLLLRRLEKIR